MHTGKRTRNIRLKELKTAYLEKLRKLAFGVMEDELNNKVVLPRELEGEIWDYYRKTSPSLQEFYSRYTPEWEVFYENETLSVSDFMSFLIRMRSAFAKRYNLMELNVDYYISALSNAGTDIAAGEELKEIFLDKWHRLLTNKEYNYQYSHIDELCNSFHILEKKSGMPLENTLTGERLKWLLRNNPSLYRKMIPFEKNMTANRQIRELVSLLGRRSKGEKMSFDSLGGISKERLVRHSVQSDIEGITVGNNLNSLLPVEYCYLSDEALRPVFMQRYVEKRLQVFETKSAEDNSAKSDTPQPVSSQGPFVVCIDTSGSMQGKREVLAKSAVLAIARLVESTRRKCYVINFSEDIECLLISDVSRDMPLLCDFLCKRFDGGTDILPAIREAVTLVRTHGWHKADIVMISDFEMPPPDDRFMEAVRKAKLRETSFYAMVFGTRPETDYLSLCDKWWDMSIPSS